MVIDMEDSEIIELYFARSELAIWKTDKKYGDYLHQVAYHILRSLCDTEEIINDTYMGAWKAIPPTRPDSLKYCRVSPEICLLTGWIISMPEKDMRFLWKWMSVFRIGRVIWKRYGKRKK